MGFISKVRIYEQKSHIKTKRGFPENYLMNLNLEKLINAKLPVLHFIGFSFLAIVFVSLSYVFFIPLIYWCLFGEGASAARISEQPVNLFLGEWGALLIALLFCCIFFFRAYRSKPGQAKSYLLIALLLLVLHPFRREIGDCVFYLFQ